MLAGLTPTLEKLIMLIRFIDWLTHEASFCATYAVFAAPFVIVVVVLALFN